MLGEQLASAHMVQHLLIADLAAIALTLALTRHVLRPVTRRIQRLEQRAGIFGHPVFGALAYVGTMWFWHIPVFYDATLHNDLVHVLEHLSFAAAGLLYWWHLLSPIPSRHRLKGLGTVAYMGVTKIVVGFVGVMLTFAPGNAFYDYGFTADRWGMVEQVVPPAKLDAAVERCVASIVEGTPKAVRAQKRLMRRWERLSLDEAVQAGIDAFAQSVAEGEHIERMGAFVNRKRK